MWTIELTRFRVRPEMEQPLLAARHGMLDEFRRDRAGFIDAQLVRLSGGEWLPIVNWWAQGGVCRIAGQGGKRPSEQGVLRFDRRAREQRRGRTRDDHDFFTKGVTVMIEYERTGTRLV